MSGAMARTSHSLLALLVLSAVVAPSSVAWNCPPPGHGGGKPPGHGGGGHGGSPTYPSPPGHGGGGHGGGPTYPPPPHHGKPPKHHNPPPPKYCPPCKNPPPYQPSPPPYQPSPPPYQPSPPPYHPSPPPYQPSPPPYQPSPPPYQPSPPYQPPYHPSPPYQPPYQPSPPYAPPRTCPIDALKLNACVDVLSGLIHLVIGNEARAKCCPLLQGVADLDAALCLCTTIHARLLNINIYLPVALNLLITCGKHPPHGFQCPPLHAANTARQLQLRA